MTIQDLQQKNIAVLGIGVEGMATVKFLLKNSIIPTVLDEKESPSAEVFEELKRYNVPMVFGSGAFSQLDDYDVLFRSPGIRRFTSVLDEVVDKGVIITSQTQLFLNLCPCQTIGVTGTKGKGTTSSLIYEMLKKQGFDAYLGGNIGEPPLNFLDKLTAQSKVVLELSSFQLQDVEMSPHIAVVLMITSEHLDHHKDTKEYIDAKRNILRFQAKEDFAVINRDYPASNESDVYTDGNVYYVSRERETQNGCYAFGGKIWLNFGDKLEEVIETKDILLPGAHNLENVCAAVMAATLAKVQRKNIVEVLKAFKGLEHRLELVREVNGVQYYDDSFSTTPETAIAAIESFTQPEILILGGSSKNADFTQLGLTLSDSKNIKAIIGIGEEWERIKSQLKNPNSQFLMIENAQNMKQIIQAASKVAVPGDVVLLSPACASFDMFKNYKDRGEQFKREVEKL